MEEIPKLELESLILKKLLEETKSQLKNTIGALRASENMKETRIFEFETTMKYLSDIQSEVDGLTKERDDFIARTNALKDKVDKAQEERARAYEIAACRIERLTSLLDSMREREKNNDGNVLSEEAEPEAPSFTDFINLTELLEIGDIELRHKVK